MGGLGGFQMSRLGMEGQSRAMQMIGANIANVTTNGYKRTDVNFETLLGRTFSTPAVGTQGPLSVQSDIAGLRPLDIARISQQGSLKATGDAMDLAIDGPGFFVLQNELTGGDTVYGRAGDFGVSVEPDGGGGFLVDKNGYFLQGWRAAADGTFPVGGALSSMRVDSGSVVDPGQPTTWASLNVNLPADEDTGTVETHGVAVYDSTAGVRSFQFVFTKEAATNTWAFRTDGAPDDTIAVEPPAADPDAPAGSGQALAFDSHGQLLEPTVYVVRVTHGDGATSAFTLDVGGSTQFGGDFLVYQEDKDGYPPGALDTVAFAEDGILMGTFDNGQTRPLYKTALADFANPDGLAALSGNVYAESEASGSASLGAANSGGRGHLLPGTVEQSNVDLASEFTRMIMTQNAYNSSATAFKTVDEMTQTARDLKA
jgi:flagellar hook protein FlgE